MADSAAILPASRPRLVLLGLSWLALIVYFHTPVREVLAPTLDASNFASYAYFTAHGFQYGTEVVPMAGPYGFIMYGWVYSGELFYLRTAGELLLNATLATLTLWFFLRSRGSWLRCVWLAAHLAFTPFIEDLPIEWILLLGGIFLLQRPTRPGVPWLALLVTTALALLSLIKGTQLMLGLATLGVVLGGHAWLRRWRLVGQLAGGYVFALLFFWVLAGQKLQHLPAYVHGILELGGGYTDAMSIETPERVLTRGLFVSAALAAGLAWAGWHRRREALSLATLALLAGHAFVQWKHAFVRADGHAYIYFHFAMVAAVTIWLAAWHWPAARTGRRVAGIGLALGLLTWILASYGGSDEAMLPSLRTSPAAIAGRFTARFNYLCALPATRTRLEKDLATERRTHALPLISQVTGSHPVDLFGYEHGLLPLNGLNYRPRPMGGGSFNAYTPFLLQLNRDFLRDPARRPDYYLFKLQTIDERLPAQDDGLALLELIRGYRPLLLEHEHLLLKAVTPAATVAPRTLVRRALRFNESIEVPAVGDDEILLARFMVKNNWRGRVRAAVYKSPLVFASVHDRTGSSLGRYRIVPAMVASPFILSPFLAETGDLVDLYDRTSGRAVGQLTLTTSAPGWFDSNLEVEFQAVPRPAPLDRATLSELRGRFQFPFANAVPATITPAFRPHHSVRFLHPPAEASWLLAGAERELVFHYGLDPEAYERGTTNGVEFIVELRGPSGGVTRLFSRLLKPVAQPADRGDHSARVPLPIFAPGSRLVLRTDPGEYGDNAWDWAYVSRIELKKGGAYPATLFPGFSRVADAAEDENAAVVELDGRQLFLLHIPGIVHFNLTGAERKLSLGFGFLPGAYQDGGHTPGGDFVVELTQPGRPSREIFRRALRPVTAPADRGPQSAEIALPPPAAGDVLSVRTTTAPDGTNSWGWTYVSRLVIE